MSHISTWKHRITDLDALAKACEELGHEFKLLKEGESVPMFGRQRSSGVAYMKLDDWRYPLTVNEEGFVHYDNFGAETTSMNTFGLLLQKTNENTIVDHVDYSQYDEVRTTVTDTGNVEIELITY